MKTYGGIGMYKRVFTLAITLLFAVTIISACGDKDESEKDDPEDNVTEEEPEDNKEEDLDKDKTKDDEIDDNETGETNDDFAELITYMEEETEGSAKVLFESDQKMEHNMDDVNVSLDAYTLVELNDFNANFDIPFSDQTDGGVLITKYTVKNDTDKDVSYMPSMYLSYVGATKDAGNYKDLIPEEEQLPTLLSPSNDYELKSGDEVTGYYAYPFGKDQLADVLKEGEVIIEVPQPQEDADDFSSTIGEEGSFKVSLDQESADKKADNDSQNFYDDRVTMENMGDKKMVDNKDDIKETEKLGDVDITLEGYQFTEFEPNKDEAPRFESFDTGIVLLTVKFMIDNDGDAEIGKNSVSSKLTVNDGSQYTLNDGMLLLYKNDEIIDKGETGELLQVYPLDKEMYEKIWKDKSFELEIGPMKDKEAKDISKGKKVEFKLK